MLICGRKKRVTSTEPPTHQHNNDTNDAKRSRIVVDYGWIRSIHIFRWYIYNVLWLICTHANQTKPIRWMTDEKYTREHKMNKNAENKREIIHSRQTNRLKSTIYCAHNISDSFVTISGGYSIVDLSLYILSVVLMVWWWWCRYHDKNRSTEV